MLRVFVDPWMQVMPYIFMLLVVNCCSLYSLGPKDITRTVGEKDVFIPCLYHGRHIQAWDIKYGANTMVKRYDQMAVSDIHQHFAPKINLGILIHTITAEMNGTTFQCYSTSEIAGEYLSSSSQTGILTVLPQCNYSTNNMVNSTSSSCRSIFSMCLANRYPIFFTFMLISVFL